MPIFGGIIFQQPKTKLKQRKLPMFWAIVMISKDRQ